MLFYKQYTGDTIELSAITAQILFRFFAGFAWEGIVVKSVAPALCNCTMADKATIRVTHQDGTLHRLLRFDNQNCFTILPDDPPIEDN